jgi:hypothetical protein
MGRTHNCTIVIRFCIPAASDDYFVRVLDSRVLEMVKGVVGPATLLPPVILSEGNRLAESGGPWRPVQYGVDTHCVQISSN